MSKGVRTLFVVIGVAGLLLLMLAVIKRPPAAKRTSTTTTTQYGTKTTGQPTSSGGVSTAPGVTEIPQTTQPQDLQTRAVAFLEAYNLIMPNDDENTCKGRVQQYMYQGETPAHHNPLNELSCPVSPGTQADVNRKKEQLTTKGVAQQQRIQSGTDDSEPSASVVVVPVVITTTNPAGAETSPPVELQTKTQLVQQNGQWVVTTSTQEGGGSG